MSKIVWGPVQSAIGFALCCGEPPVVRQAGYEQTLHTICLKCGRQLGVWGHDVSFMRSNWNRLFTPGRGAAGMRPEHVELPIPELYGRPGWVSCDVEIQFARFGHTDERRLNGCLFYLPTPNERTQESLLYDDESPYYSCVVDRCRHIHDIAIEHPTGRVLRLTWKDGKRYPYSSVYAFTHSWSTGHYEWGLRVHSTRAKEYQQLYEWLEGPKEES